MATEKQALRIRYQKLHRFLNGLTVVCFIVVTIASSLAGASTAEIVKRALYVIAALSVLSWAIVKTWAAWEAVRRGEHR